MNSFSLRTRWAQVRAITVALAVIAICGELKAATPSGIAPCQELREHVGRGRNLSRLAIEREALERADLDGDGRPDSAVLTCPGSPPWSQADPCFVDISMATGEKYQFEGWRIFFADYRGTPLAVVSGAWKGKRRPKSIDIYRFEGSGMQRFCSMSY